MKTKVKKYITLLVLQCMVTGVFTSLQAYKYTIKNNLQRDPKRGLDAETIKEIDICGYPSKCQDAKDITPGKEVTFDTGANCLDYLSVDSPTLGHIVTRPGWTNGRFDVVPQTGSGLACRDYRGQLVWDYEGAISLQEY